MGKKNKNRSQNKKNIPQGIPKTEIPIRLISSSGKKVILAGIMIVVIGFFVLTKADPMGQNWPSKLSPMLLILGYALIGLGIIVPGKLNS